jgi:hypothetical protein
MVELYYKVRATSVVGPFPSLRKVDWKKMAQRNKEFLLNNASGYTIHQVAWLAHKLKLAQAAMKKGKSQ